MTKFIKSIIKLIKLPLFTEIETVAMEKSGKVNDVEESLKKLGGMRGAVGGIVMTLEGEIIKSTLDPSTSSQVSDLMSGLVRVARQKLSKVELKEQAGTIVF